MATRACTRPTGKHRRRAAALFREEVKRLERGLADRRAGQRRLRGPPRRRHLVDRERADRVREGREVVEPDDPGLDRGAHDDKAAVDDEHEEEEARSGVGDCGGGEEGADHAEDGGDGEGGRGEDDAEDGEVAGTVCMAAQWYMSITANIVIDIIVLMSVKLVQL